MIISLTIKPRAMMTISIKQSQSVRERRTQGRTASLDPRTATIYDRVPSPLMIV
jgi:hypothetical protein